MIIIDCFAFERQRLSFLIESLFIIAVVFLVIIQGANVECADFNLALHTWG